MIPILYSTITEGTVPSHYGVGALTDAISVTVEESRNSSYELAMTYPVNGIHASDIVPNAFIKAKPNYTDNPQLFRIYKIGKAINGIFEINAQHISYDLSGKTISSGTAINIVSACALLEASAGSFEIQTSKNTVGNFVISEPSSVRSWFGGKEGSLLDVYGGGEWKYDNYNCKLWEHRGADRGVTIRYGKNLTELNQTIDASNLYTDVLCFYKGDGGVVSGEKVSTGLSLDVEKVLVIDSTSDFQTVPEEQDLTDKATAYVGSHNLTVPLNNITLDFVQNGTLSDRVDLCDTVTVYFEALGISAKFKCIRTKWDVLTERYTETEFGDARTNITDTIGENASAINTANANASEAINLVNGKAKVFVSTPVPPYNVGDIWTDSNDIYYCVNPKVDGESFSELDWELASDYVSDSKLEEAISNASEIITGTKGGYVVFHDSDNDGSPDEILIMNTNDINTATQVWRWNKDGLGYATEYNSLSYALALTGDGQIVADRITTGSLDASRVTIQHLTASMFEGSKITLGGLNNTSGVFELKNENDIVIGEMDKDGLKFYGAGPEGQRPYVLLNNQVGFAGYDANDTPLFWVNRDEFTMEKCVARQEISACSKIRFIPITLKDANDQIINDGVAIVALIDSGA